MVSRQTWTALLTLASAAMLISAWTFQYFGYPPCKMCYWQRWPHFAAIAIGVVAYFVPHRIIAIAGALAALTTAAIGIFHTGVERDYWEGPASCTGSGLGGLSAEDLLSTLFGSHIRERWWRKLRLDH